MINVLIVNEVRLICDVISAVLADEPDIRVIGCASTVEQALERVAESDIVLVSTKLPDNGALKLTQVSTELDPSTKVLVLGLSEKKERVIRYVEAGAAGYVLKNDSVEDLIEHIRAVYSETALVSPEIAYALMSRVAELAQLFSEIEAGIADSADLTPREREILELIAEGMTNKQIADRLVIEIGTVKNHVHNILQKLDVASRGDAAAYLALIK